MVRIATWNVNSLRSRIDRVEASASRHLVGVHADDPRPAGAATVQCYVTRADAGQNELVVVETNPEPGVPAYDSWWDVPVAEVSEMDSVAEARAAWERMRPKERHFLETETPGVPAQEA